MSHAHILEENPKTQTKQILVAGMKHAPGLLMSLYINIKTPKCSSVANFIQVSISTVSSHMVLVSSAYPKAFEMLSVYRSPLLRRAHHSRCAAAPMARPATP